MWCFQSITFFGHNFYFVQNPTDCGFKCAPLNMQNGINGEFHQKFNRMFENAFDQKLLLLIHQIYETIPIT